VEKQTDTQTTGGKNPIPATAFGATRSSSSSSSINFTDMNRMDRETKHINVKRLD